MSNEDTLSLLPTELQVECTSYLQPREVDELRLVSKRVKELVDRHSTQLYTGREIKVQYESEDGEEFDVIIGRSWEARITVNTNGDCVRIATKIYGSEAAIGDLTNTPRTTIDDWRTGVESAFLGRPFKDCYRALSERSGGVCLHFLRSLTINHNNLTILMPVLENAKLLSLDCDIRIPKEDAYRLLFAPKRKLTINTIFRTPDLLDDRFFKDAGTKEIRVNVYAAPLPLSDAQLLMLVGRNDVSTITISDVKGPTLDGIRAAIQKLLSCRKNISVPFDCDDPFSLAKDRLSERIGEVATVKRVEHLARYNRELLVHSLDDRDVVVIVLANAEDNNSTVHLSAGELRDWDEENDWDEMSDL